MADRPRTTALDWDDVRHFVALARTGSLSAAARSLRVNHATVSRRLAAMERDLGQPLFDRRRDGYALTAHGQSLLPAGLAMEQAAATIADGIAARAPGGTVRLATVRSLADAFLTAELCAFLRDQRDRCGLCVEVVTDTRVVSLARREADVALRVGRPADSGLVGRRLARIEYAYYATPDLAAVASGADVPAVGYASDEAGALEAAWIERRFAGRRFGFRSDSPIAQMRAALGGVGVAMLPRYLAARHVGLVAVDLGSPHPPRDLWLLSPRELARVPRVRSVLGAVAEAVERDRRRTGW